MNEFILPERIRVCCQIKKDGVRVELTHNSSISVAIILEEILKKYSISDISIKDPQIEDLVMEVYNS